MAFFRITDEVWSYCAAFSVAKVLYTDEVTKYPMELEILRGMLLEESIATHAMSTAANSDGFMQIVSIKASGLE